MLDSTPAAAVEQRDLYDRWPEFFRSWADDSTVLVGDAVHPMMPNLGQGGCQASRARPACASPRRMSAVCSFCAQVADACAEKEMAGQEVNIPLTIGAHPRRPVFARACRCVFCPLVLVMSLWFPLPTR